MSGETDKLRHRLQSQEHQIQLLTKQLETASAYLKKLGVTNLNAPPPHATAAARLQHPQSPAAPPAPVPAGIMKAVPLAFQLQPQQPNALPAASPPLQHSVSTPTAASSPPAGAAVAPAPAAEEKVDFLTAYMREQEKKNAAAGAAAGGAGGGKGGAGSGGSGPAPAPSLSRQTTPKPNPPVSAPPTPTPVPAAAPTETLPVTAAVATAPSAAPAVTTPPAATPTAAVTAPSTPVVSVSTPSASAASPSSSAAAAASTSTSASPPTSASPARVHSPLASIGAAAASAAVGRSPSTHSVGSITGSGSSAGSRRHDCEWVRRSHVWERKFDGLQARYQSLLHDAENGRNSADADARYRTSFFDSVRTASLITTKKQLETGIWKANEIPQVAKSGWLVKKSRGFHDLIQQKRWFVLIGSSLYYYKSNTDFKPRGLMSLRNCSLRVVSSKLNNYCFCLLLAGSQKTYFLFTENETQLDEWVAALSDASVLHLRMTYSLASLDTDGSSSATTDRARADSWETVNKELRRASEMGLRVNGLDVKELTSNLAGAAAANSKHYHTIASSTQTGGANVGGSSSSASHAAGGKDSAGSDAAVVVTPTSASSGVSGGTSGTSGGTSGDPNFKLEVDVSALLLSYPSDDAFLERVMTDLIAMKPKEKWITTAYEPNMIAARDLLCTKHGIVAFVRTLNALRRQRTLDNLYGFKRLVELFSIALLTAYQVGDWKSAKNFWNMGNTYSITVGEKTGYVMDYLRDHKIWTSIRGWEELFFECMLAERHKQTATEGGSGDTSAGAVPPLTTPATSTAAVSPPPPIQTSPTAGSTDAIPVTVSGSAPASAGTPLAAATPAAGDVKGTAPPASATPAPVAMSRADAIAATSAASGDASAVATSPPAGRGRTIAMAASSADAPDRAVERAKRLQLIERDANIAFGQLVSFASEMARFRLSFSTVSHFCMKMCIATNVPDERREFLFEHLNSTFKALSEAVAAPSSSSTGLI